MSRKREEEKKTPPTLEETTPAKRSLICTYTNSRIFLLIEKVHRVQHIEMSKKTKSPRVYAHVKLLHIYVHEKKKKLGAFLSLYLYGSHRSRKGVKATCAYPGPRVKVPWQINNLHVYTRTHTQAHQYYTSRQRRSTHIGDNGE